MAAGRWRTGRPVEDVLFAEPYRFDVFQAVSLLEARDPDAVPVGEGTDPAREAVRFRSGAGLGFPASQIAALDRPAAGEHTAPMAVSFMGFTGYAGPLPASFAELIQARASKRDYALRDFLDLFVHRLTSLMVRGRKKHRIGLDRRHPDQTHFADYLFALMGLGTGALRQRMAVRDRALLAFAGLLSQRPRSAVGLEILLGRYFRVPVRVRQFLGRWLDISEDEWTVLGREGRNRRLGQGAVLGTRTWVQNDLFELRVGPLSLDRFLDFLPDRPGFAGLCDLTRFYGGTETDFVVRLEIEAAQVPPLRLSAADGVARLGWTTWLKTAEWAENDSQVRLRPPFGVSASVP